MNFLYSGRRMVLRVKGAIMGTKWSSGLTPRGFITIARAFVDEFPLTLLVGVT